MENKLIWLCLLACALLTAGCGQSIDGQCWNKAIYAYGSSIANGHTSKIYIQETPRSNEGIYHAQTAIIIDGDPQWLNVYG